MPSQVAAFAFFARHSVDFIARNHDAAALEYSAGHVLDLPARLVFAAGTADAHRLGEGWYLPESDGVWSGATDSGVELAIRAHEAGVVLRLETSVYVSERSPENGMRVVVNGVTLARQTRTPSNHDQPVEVRVPAELTRSGALHVQLHVDRCVAPLREGTYAEPRPIGVMLSAIEIRRTEG